MILLKIDVSDPAETARSSLRVLEMELPIALARRHRRAFVGFDFTGDLLGWHARLVGDDGDVILNFPWYDHADRSLVEAFPTALTEEGWDDLDQGWWGQVIPFGEDVFIAEADLDELLSGSHETTIVVARPGCLFARGVLVTWNCVSREHYDAAWKSAIDACRRGIPSPVGRRVAAPVRNPETGQVAAVSRFVQEGA
jgi:hypothetical protein